MQEWRQMAEEWWRLLGRWGPPLAAWAVEVAGALAGAACALKGVCCVVAVWREVGNWEGEEGGGKAVGVWGLAGDVGEALVGEAAVESSGASSPQRAL